MKFGSSSKHHESHLGYVIETTYFSSNTKIDCSDNDLKLKNSRN